MAKSVGLRVAITGDSSDLERALKRSDTALERLNRAGAKVGRGLRTGIGLAGFAAAAGLTASAKAAVEAEKSQARMEAQLKASGISLKDHAAAIDTAIQKTSQLSGLDDEDLQDSFTNLVRATGDVNQALRLNGLAADFARAKNIDVAKAGELVAKVAGGNTGILSRYGVTIKDGATATQALGALQQKFAGQAKAYGETTAGSLDRAKVASENLGEMVGAKLAPVIRKLAEVALDLANKLQAAWPAIQRTAETVFGAVAGAVSKVKNAITGFVSKNRGDIQSFLNAIKNVATVVKAVFENVVIPVVQRLLPAIKTIFSGVTTAIRGAVRIISGILTLDLGKAWDGVKDIFRAAVKVVGGVIRAATAPIRAAAGGIAKAISGPLNGAADAIKKGFGDMVQFLKSRLADALWVFQKILEGASHLPLIGDSAKKAAAGLQKLRDELYGAKAAADSASASFFQAAQNVAALGRAEDALGTDPIPIQPRKPHSVGTGSSGGWGGGTGPVAPGLHVGGAGSAARSLMDAAAASKPKPITHLDRLTRNEAVSELTKKDRDDLKAAQDLRDFWKRRRHAAKQAGHVRQETEAAQNEVSAQQSIEAIKEERRRKKQAKRDREKGDPGATGTTDTGTAEDDPNQAVVDAINAAAEQAAALAAEQAERDAAQAALVTAQTAAANEVARAVSADTALRERIFGTQTGQILAGIADMVSTVQGGKIGLGVATPSYPGGRVRY